MSFTAEVKDELARVLPECSHCGKATLAALVRIEGTLFVSGPGRYRVEIATDVPSVARLVIKLLHGIYQLRTELTVRRSVLHKTPNYLIEVPRTPICPNRCSIWASSPRKAAWRLAFVPTSWPSSAAPQPTCAARFKNGGFIANPRGDFHFEITVESESLAEGLVALLADKGIKARIMQRRSSYMVYLKSGNAILEFLAFVGAHQCALRLEQERVVKSVRNDVNRMTNAEIANQAKSSSAAVDQLFAIRTVLEAHGMENLPPALQEFIRLRVSFPRREHQGARRAREPAALQIGGLSSHSAHRAACARSRKTEKRVAAPQAIRPKTASIRARSARLTPVRVKESNPSKGDFAWQSR